MQLDIQSSCVVREGGRRRGLSSLYHTFAAVPVAPVATAATVAPELFFSLQFSIKWVINVSRFYHWQIRSEAFQHLLRPAPGPHEGPC